MICPNCHKEVSDDALFCKYCGTPLHNTKKICPYCHVENDPDAIFCKQCGRPLTANQANSQNQPPHYESKYPDYVPLTTSVPKQNNDVETSYDHGVVFEKTDRKVNWKKVIAGVLVLIVLTGGSNYYLRHSAKLNVTNQPSSSSAMVSNGSTFNTAATSTLENYSNLANNGTLASDGDTIYTTNDQGYLIKTSKNFKNPQVLVKEKVNYINVNHKIIYFTDANHQLCMTSSNGGKKIVLVKKACYYVTYHDHSLYYQLDSDNESLYVYNLKTKKSSRLIEKHVYNLSFNGDDLYYNGSDGIYVYHLKTNKNEQILDGKNLNVIYYDGYCYYIANDSLMRVDVKTKKSETIVSTTGNSSVMQMINVGTYVMNKKAIYFYSVSPMTSGSIYRIDLKTKKVTSIIDGITLSSYDLQIINDNIVVKINNKWVGINTSDKKANPLFSSEV